MKTVVCSLENCSIRDCPYISRLQVLTQRECYKEMKCSPNELVLEVRNARQRRPCCRLQLVKWAATDMVLWEEREMGEAAGGGETQREAGFLGGNVRWASDSSRKHQGKEVAFWDEKIAQHLCTNKLKKKICAERKINSTWYHLYVGSKKVEPREIELGVGWEWGDIDQREQTSNCKINKF